ncbi:hypothetical protein K8R43_01920 [archaeon]|nr:hypothetical protein [archaeon]
MKKLFLILLLLSGTLAGSAVNKEEIRFKVNPQGELTTELTQLMLYVESKDVDIINLTVNFSKVPTGITLNDNQTKTISWVIGGLWQETSVNWSIEDSSPTKINASEAFELVSWDNNVALNDLKANDKPIVDGMILHENYVIISGMIDPQGYSDEFCSALITRGRKGCVNEIKINNYKPITAEKDGTFTSEKIELSKGEKQISITATDMAGNTKTASFTITYEPTVTDILEGSLIWIVVGIMFIVTLMIIFMIIRLVRSIRQKETKYEDIKKRRKELKERLAKMEQKAAYLGMNENQKAKKDALEIEYSTITEQLNKNQKFQKELDERAKKTVQQSKQGTPSEEIREQLVEEGYSPQEIEQIKEKFKKFKEK